LDHEKLKLATNPTIFCSIISISKQLKNIVAEEEYSKCNNFVEMKRQPVNENVSLKALEKIIKRWLACP
jgi:hypothetical protein